MDERTNEHTSAQALLDAMEHDGFARLVIAPPASGKTEFALNVLLEALRARGSGSAVMTVSGRTVADELSERVIRRIGALSQARPVTTLGAVAFRLIEASRVRAGKQAPRLLNGAEQDSLLRGVMNAHVSHARHGDYCQTCDLLGKYYAQSNWLPLLGAEGSTSERMFSQGASGAFIDQLRDMLARLDELGVGPEREHELLQAVTSNARIGVQWRLSFALRSEYIAAQRREYPGEYRLDASYLLVEGERVVHKAMNEHRLRDMNMPDVLVVDDVQDVTLAGLRFLEVLHEAGVDVVLVGNPDEAVQTFRGSYPEYVMNEAERGMLKAIELPLQGRECGTICNADVLDARVSLSIPSSWNERAPLAQRPGKLTASLDAGLRDGDDESLHTALYRSPREELDDVVWRIKRRHLDQRVAWNDMAVIAHDNATVRLFGERLRRDGVPVRYSSVTRPLREEPFIQGLFAMVELADLRRQGVDGCSMGLSSLASYVRVRARELMESPLITTGSKPGQGSPGRMSPVESAMAALDSLSSIAQQTAVIARLREEWDRLHAAWTEARGAQDDMDAFPSRKPANVRIDDSLVADDEDLTFGEDALFVMLAIGDADAVLQAVNAVLGRDPQARAFANLWHSVNALASAWGALPSGMRGEPRYVLWQAWRAAGVAGPWQREALSDTAQGRAANDRLDASMRLFQAAEGFAAGKNVNDFIVQTRSAQIEADSLAHVGPVEDAVTLATPAGAAGRHWDHLWIPSLQQGVWPNLTERATMFAGEALTEQVLFGRIDDVGADGRDPRLVELLSSEKKSFLVALTRARRTVSLSAVWNDDATPSDFLFGYLPEWHARNREQATFATVGDMPERGTEPLAGLDADPRGLVAAARLTLATALPGSPDSDDAAAALALLARHGVEAAHPDTWAFVTDGDATGSVPAKASETRDVREVLAEECDHNGAVAQQPVAALSPSAVDRLWDCPVCWLLENRFAGPRSGSVSTSFGTLIHAIAQQGSKDGLDRSGQSAEAIASRLHELYMQLRSDPAAIADPQDRYRAIRKDEAAPTALGNIASYFASCIGDERVYLGKNAGKFAIGVLDHADCEREFAARFDLNDILVAYNALPGMEPIDRHQLYLLMGLLVGGWPEGMREDLCVRLFGRIDRMETRTLADGRRNIRLIDYKTGKVPRLQRLFNDLQLVCYQLGLVFPEDGPRGAEALAGMPSIGQSMLFHVEAKSSPAESHAPEGIYQPPLFTGGSLNAEAFIPRYHYSQPTALFDMPMLSDDHRPDEVGSQAWEQYTALAGTQALWSLTMIARVFYAAAASRSLRLEAHPQPSHIDYCRLKDVCPACAGRMDTVFEMRQA